MRLFLTQKLDMRGGLSLKMLQSDVVISTISTSAAAGRNKNFVPFAECRRLPLERRRRLIISREAARC
jgi:hypothetical protein